MNIKELEITKEMYNRAKEVEDICKKLKELNCRTEEFKKLNNKSIKLEDKFAEEFTDEFVTLEIVNEYERRERNKKNKKVCGGKEKMSKQVAWVTNLLNIGVMSFLVLKNFSPMSGVIACSIAVLTILVAVIPEALTLKEVYNDEI